MIENIDILKDIPRLLERTRLAVLLFINNKKDKEDNKFTENMLAEIVAITVRNESLQNIQVDINDILNHLIQLKLIDKLDNDMYIVLNER